MIPNQQPSYQSMMGVQQPQNPALLNSQRAGMGGQIQSIMVQYPQMPSYQVMQEDSSVGYLDQFDWEFQFETPRFNQPFNSYLNPVNPFFSIDFEKGKLKCKLYVKWSQKFMHAIVVIGCSWYS